jgi:hypothetical protein
METKDGGLERGANGSRRQEERGRHVTDRRKRQT